MNEWIFILIILVCVGLYSIYKTNRNDRKLKKKSDKRGIISRSDFVKTLEEKNYDIEWIEKLYDRISDYVPKKDFSMAPTDNLVEEYRIDDEDLSDIANELFEERNGIKPNRNDTEKAEKYGASIKTFEEILLYITRERYQ